MTEELKRCAGCEEAKPLSDYYFEKGKPRNKCKACHKAVAYRKRETEEYKTRQAAWEKENRPKRRRQFREWTRANADRINAGRRAARAADPQRFRELDRERYTRDGERIRELRRARYAESPERDLEINRRWRERNPDKMQEANARKRAENATPEGRAKKLAYNRVYYRTHLDLFAMHRRKREARLAEVEWESYTRTEIFDRDGGRCQSCGLELKNEPFGFNIDHIVPIDLGGPDIRSNLQLLCFPCNREKWANLEGQIHLPV